MKTAKSTIERRVRQIRFAAQETVLLLLAAAIGLYAWRFGALNAGPVRAAMCALLSGGFLVLSHVILFGSEALKNTLRRRQWPVWLLLCAVWTGLNLNNTSISQWLQWLPGEKRGLVWGMPRGIRSDEWAVWTPFLVSQAKNGYPAVSTYFTGRQVPAGWISVGGLPALSPLLAFKPFYWGFLLLGAERGYSLLSFLRFFFLLWISYRTALRYTRGNHLLSAAAAAMLTLSPYVQWWYSQSICEVLIFSQAAVLLTDRYTGTKNRGLRWLYASAGAWCLGCYAMIAYPAWIISVGYLLVAVLVWQLCSRREALQLTDLWRLLPLMLVLAVLLLCARSDGDTLRRVMESEYPGQRLYTGGEVPQSLLTGLASLLFPLDGTVSNPSEMSNILTLAPAGLVLAIWHLARKRSRDGLAAVLVLLEAALWAFQLFGCPAWLARITLLGQCTRNTLVIGLCDLLLLFRSLSANIQESPKRALCAAVLCCIPWAVLLLAGNPLGWKTVLLVLLYLLLYLMVFSGWARELLCAVLIGLSVLGGAFVNPIQQGLALTETLAPVKAIGAAEAAEGTLFAVEGDWPVTNAAAFSGRPVLNTTQPYPDPERWEAVDPTGSYRKVYNRFCHISLRVADTTSFELLHEDHIRAWLTLKDLRSLGVTHLVSQWQYPQYQLVSAAGDWYVWLIED